MRVGKTDYPIERLPLRKVFRLIALVKDFAGPIVDQVQGNLPPEVIQQIRDVQGETEEEKRSAVNAIITAHMATVDTSITGMVNLMLSEEERAYEIVALCLNPDIPGIGEGKRPTVAQIEWCADNVPLGTSVKIVKTVIVAELTEDFFSDTQEMTTVLRKAGVFGTDTSETEDTTSFNGYGESPPISDSDGSDSPILTLS